MSKEIAYSLSCNSWGDGKSICLWRREGNVLSKVARFRSDQMAKLFAKEFNFPLSAELKERLNKKEEAE